MSQPATLPASTGREWARPEQERFATSASVLTLARTALTLALAGWAVVAGSLTLLLCALGAYWVGDIADGALARLRDEETRIGAVLDIVCDRASAAAFYLGFAWYDTSMAVPAIVYLAEFMVLDAFLSLAFLAWPISSPNYFYVVDARIWRWNWSKPAKAVNSSIIAVIMVVTRDPWITTSIALALLAAKAVSLGLLMRLGLPVPGTERTTGDPGYGASAHEFSTTREQGR